MDVHSLASSSSSLSPNTAHQAQVGPARVMRVEVVVTMGGKDQLVTSCTLSYLTESYTGNIVGNMFQSFTNNFFFFVREVLFSFCNSFVPVTEHKRHISTLPKSYLVSVSWIWMESF